MRAQRHLSAAESETAVLMASRLESSSKLARHFVFALHHARQIYSGMPDILSFLQ